MANDDYREQHERDRAAGLAARHETRVERAIRRQVAEEIAQALEEYVEHYPEDIFPADSTTPDAIAAKAMRHAYPNAARIAREIAAEETP